MSILALNRRDPRTASGFTSCHEHRKTGSSSQRVDSKNEDVYTEKLAFCKFHGVVSTDSSRRAFAVPGG